MQTHVKQLLFCVCMFLFYCVLILYQKQPILSRKTQEVWKGISVTLLAKKMLWHNRFLSHFLKGNVKHIKMSKRASKAVHSRILNPIFLQSEVVIPEMQNGEKDILCCNGFMAPKCVTRIAIAVFLVCDKIFSKNNAIFNAE